MVVFNFEKEYHDLRVMYDRMFDQGIAAINESVRLRADLAAANERAGRWEEEREQLREAWSLINAEAIDEYAETLTHIVAARAMLNAAFSGGA